MNKTLTFRFWAPLFCGLLPLLAVVVAASISITHGKIPDCQLLLEGCVSISRAVRQEGAISVFKPLMLTAIALHFLFWWHIVRGALPSKVLGVLATIALLVYVLTLGGDSELYRFMRRIGIYFYFAGTVSAQLLTFIVLSNRKANHFYREFRHPLWMFSIMPIVLGVAHVVIKLMWDSDAWENRFEWWIGALMSLWYVAYGYLHREKSSR